MSGKVTGQIKRFVHHFSILLPTLLFHDDKELSARINPAR